MPCGDLMQYLDLTVLTVLGGGMQELRNATCKDHNIRKLAALGQ